MHYQYEAPFGHDYDDRCAFTMPVLGRCKRPTEKKGVCEYHLDQRCQCGEQALFACEHDDCGALTCSECESSHQQYHSRSIYELS